MKSECSRNLIRNESSHPELDAKSIKTNSTESEKINETYNLYVSKYNNKAEVGVKPALILELLIENYDKSLPEHRIAMRQYLG